MPMSSLQTHMERHEFAVGALPFRRDCPLCRAERLHGRLPSGALVPPRVCAVMSAAVVATSAVAPGTVAADDGQGVAVPAPASPPPPQVADVGVGGGGAAPVDSDDGARHEPAGPGDQGPDRHARPSDRTQETESVSGAVEPSEGGGSSTESIARPDSGDSAGSGDAATVQATPAAEPAGDSAPTGRPDEPDRSADTPGPAAAPAPSQDESAAPAPPHAPSDTGRGTLSPGPPASPASGHAVGANHSGGSEEHRASGSKEHAASASERRSSSNSGGTAGDDRGGARDARDGDGSTERGRRTARDGEVLVADATAARSDRTARRAEREETEQPATYRVRPGDSLWRIAGRHLGPDATVTATAQEVTRLWELNRQRIGTGNPDLIFPGQTLRM